jgi:hypothetical protein
LREVLDPSSLDALDPPPWDSPPTDATTLIRRCHNLRRKPISEFTVEDLRLMIGQRIALAHLVPLALAHLDIDPLAEGDFYPGDLLTVVLHVQPSFWQQNPMLASQLHRALDRLPDETDPQLADDVASFRAANNR